VTEGDWLAERFEEHRERPRAAAYRMLGSLAEADDVALPAGASHWPRGAAAVARASLGFARTARLASPRS
jgi:hypothetical protein